MIAVGIATLVVVALIIYGIRSRKDRGMIPSIEINRNSIPFNLFLDEAMVEEFPVVRDALQGAIDFINDSVGHVMFMRLGEFGRGEIVPVMPHDPNDCKSSDLCHENAFAFVRIANGKPEALYVNTSTLERLDEDAVRYGLAHELGHILGLDHDDFTTSLMYPKLADKEPTITERDLEIIRLTYGLTEPRKSA